MIHPPQPPKSFFISAFIYLGFLSLSLFFFSFPETGSLTVTKAGVQWCNHSSLESQTLSSSNPPTLASRVAGTTSVCHNTQLIFFMFVVEMEFHHVGQAGLGLLTSGDPSALASQSAGITGVSHCTQPPIFLYF